MTREEAKEIMLKLKEEITKDFDVLEDEEKEAFNKAIEALEQEPCEDAVSRQYLLDLANKDEAYDYVSAKEIAEAPSVRPQEQTGHCKDCKYFEYDSVAKVDGIPLIVAHEICNKWGDGCKTKEDGYCFLFEPQESEDKE